MPHNDAPRTDEQLDEAIEESFPASDAPANTPETGITRPSTDAPDRGPAPQRDGRPTPPADRPPARRR